MQAAHQIELWPNCFQKIEHPHRNIMQTVSPDGVLEIEGAKLTMIQLDVIVPKVAMNYTQIAIGELIVLFFDTLASLEIFQTAPSGISYP